MSNATRERFLYLLLAVILAAGAVLYLRQASTPRAPYHPRSRRADGTLVLWQWLQNMGYEMRQLPPRGADLPADADMIILFPGDMPLTDADARMLHDWVAGGRTLALVAMANQNEVRQQFGLSLTQMLPAWSARVEQDAPLLPQANGIFTSHLSMNWGMDVQSAPAALSALRSPTSQDGMVAAAVQAVGDGVVWHLGPQVAPTNQALRGEMGALVPALLRTVPAGGVILMDRYHPVQVESQTPAPTPERNALLRTLLRSAWGRAMLLAGLLLLFFLLMSGRRLGPPLLPEPVIRRREAAEYVEAMARLKQRAHQRTAIARYQESRLRVWLARRWHVDSSLPADALIAALRRSSPPPTDALLQRIEQTLVGLASAPSEAELVALAAQIDELIETR